MHPVPTNGCQFYIRAGHPVTMAVFAAYCSGGRCTGLQPAIPSTLRRGSVLSIFKIVMQVEVLLFILLLFLSVNRFELSGSSADLCRKLSLKSSGAKQSGRLECIRFQNGCLASWKEWKKSLCQSYLEVDSIFILIILFHNHKTSCSRVLVPLGLQARAGHVRFSTCLMFPHCISSCRYLARGSSYLGQERAISILIRLVLSSLHNRP